MPLVTIKKKTNNNTENKNEGGVVFRIQDPTSKGSHQPKLSNSSIHTVMIYKPLRKPGFMNPY